ncbi:hypothetical protein CR152_19305 [Massilia violaceinigra]|uniref:Uncharacterized protein n=1 Tax=Massilia violaceinigra TaxID=2045208 RepID=A0A2D2DN65_9BURK|nr:hypothetical protein [Massilia violaceinigra]ATQ76435.1 hypothetical protein CR152_19305 [Massilia violaceinigra]
MMLDMYRQEATAARQESAYGAMLELRPFLFKGASLLVVALAVLLMASLMLGRAARIVQVPAVALAGDPVAPHAVRLALAGPAPVLRPGQQALLRRAGAPALALPGSVARFEAGTPVRVLFSTDAAHAAQLADMLRGGAELRLELRLPAQTFGQWLSGVALQRGGKQ